MVTIGTYHLGETKECQRIKAYSYFTTPITCPLFSSHQINRPCPPKPIFFSLEQQMNPQVLPTRDWLSDSDLRIYRRLRFLKHPDADFFNITVLTSDAFTREGRKAEGLWSQPSSGISLRHTAGREVDCTGWRRYCELWTKVDQVWLAQAKMFEPTWIFKKVKHPQ